jgi:hypothetical protein
MVRVSGSQRDERYVATANLDAVLIAQGRKQAWLAGRLGVSTSLLCLIIGGVKTVDHARGQQIADALGVPFRLLFKLRSRSDSVAGASARVAPATMASAPIKPRLVVRQGDRQRELGPATNPHEERSSQPDTGVRAPPREI